MARSSEELQRDAFAIWQAGVDAVSSSNLVQKHVCIEDDRLIIGEASFNLNRIRKIAVVGAGKAGAGMAAGLESVLEKNLLAVEKLTGWINVPADCVTTTKKIHLHAARPAGINEPTQAGVEGTSRILEMVAGLTPADLCICLLSGGGSALLPAPVSGISLADKQAITRFLSGAGANIEELNTVRKQLSRIKGGQLSQTCRAGHLVTLIISDVLGDPLDIIASGPTILHPNSPHDALQVLKTFGAQHEVSCRTVFNFLQTTSDAPQTSNRVEARQEVMNFVIGNNATAVNAAGIEAIRRGYAPITSSSNTSEGPAEKIGQEIADWLIQHQPTMGPNCLISGGEPTVQLIEESKRGLGGRNQQLVLAAFEHLRNHSPAKDTSPDVKKQNKRFALLSGGTDGEDGPTDAAGAWINETTQEKCLANELDPRYFLDHNDAYHFFERLRQLIKTGPTHTNVCDLRIVTLDHDAQATP